jgi:ketosteroid isomerase-like protein
MDQRRPPEPKPAGDDAARGPQDLERLLVARQHAGDVAGMVALYEPDALLDPGDGRLIRGTVELAVFFADAIARGQVYAVGRQNPPLVSGDVALTSTTMPDGSVTAEIARRQPDGTWRWVVDRFAHCDATDADAPRSAGG